MIVGTGNVGASIAFAIVNQQTPVQEIILTDLNSADATGEAMDLADALSVVSSWVKISTGTYADTTDCDICILTAGANQKPGESRTDLLEKNAEIVRSITKSVMDSGFSGIFIVVTNPVDVLTHVVLQTSGLPPEQVVGSGTLLDSSRLHNAISEELHIHPKSIHAYQVGEHGDSEVTLWSLANIGGETIDHFLSRERQAVISTKVRKKAYQIISRKGATYYGIGACVVQILRAILDDERRVLPISSYDDCQDVYYGFPTVIGRAGAIRRLDLKLPETEAVALQKSINQIKKHQSSQK